MRIGFVKLPNSLPKSSVNPAPLGRVVVFQCQKPSCCLLFSVERSVAVPGDRQRRTVPLGTNGNRYSLLGHPDEKVQTLIFCCQVDIFAVVLMPVFFLMCVCVSSSLLQVHLCPLYPFLLFRLSSWFLPPPSRATHAAFSWIILSVPVLGSG